MNDTVANPSQGAEPAEEVKQELSTEEQIANAMNLGEDEPKQTPKKETPKKSDEEEGDKPQPKADDNKDDDSDNTDDSNDDDANADSDDSEDSDDNNSEDEDDKEPEFKSLEELAEAAEMSVDDIKALFKGKIKVQGKEIEVTYDELLKGQMLETDYRLKTSNLAEDKRVFEQDRTEATEVVRAQVIESANVLQAVIHEFTEENKNTNWEELKRIDPTEYSLRRTEASEKAQKLEGWKVKIKHHHDRIQAESNQKKNVEVESYQVQQGENIKRLIPSWIDPDVADRESGEIRNWLKSAFDGDLNFTDSEIDNLADARMVAIIRKAMEMDKNRKKADHIKKKVTGTRKILKSNAKGPKKSTKPSYKQKTTRAIKSGSVQDAEQAILGML